MTSVLAGVDQRTRLAGHNRLELLLFRLTAKQRFGINVFKVQEVIHCPPLTRIPHSHPAVRGIASMRGRTIPVMDLSLAIGCMPLDANASSFVIVTEYNRSVQGFLVEAVDRIVNLKWEEILPPPKGLGDANYMTAVTRVDDELVEIVDVERVLKEVMGDQGVISEGVIDTTSTAEGQHVLVADDSSVARKQIKRVLDEIGVPCTLVENGQEALDRLQAWAAEGKDMARWLAMVISDVEMPQLDGYSLTTAVRKDPQLAALHVMLHTSLSGVFNQTMVERVGANRFIAKFKPDELAVLVQDRLREHAAQFGLKSAPAS